MGGGGWGGCVSRMRTIDVSLVVTWGHSGSRKDTGHTYVARHAIEGATWGGVRQGWGRSRRPRVVPEPTGEGGGGEAARHRLLFSPAIAPFTPGILLFFASI